MDGPSSNVEDASPLERTIVSESAENLPLAAIRHSTGAI